MRELARAAVVIALLTSTAAPALAQETDGAADSLPLVRVPEIVVTATRSPVPRVEIGSAISVVSRDEIERRQYRVATEALRQLPGVAVARAGGPGGQTSVFLRGAASEHTLVLVDGVEMNDPSAPAGAYDFANLSLHDVERIEVLRGPQSTLYGSAAMGGVVQLFTRRGDPEERASLRVEAGTFGTWRSTAAASGGAGSVRWAGSATRLETEGISANPAETGAAEDDHDRVTGFSGRLDWSPDPALALAFTLRGHDTETGLDQGGPAGDDPNFRIRTDELTVRARARWRSAERWEQDLTVALARHDRESSDEVDSARPQTRSRGSFEGERWEVEWLHELETPLGRLSGGLEHERASAESRFRSEGPFGPFESEFPEEEASITGAFLQHRGELRDRLHWSVGARVDDHERYGSAATWRAAPTLRFPRSGTRIRASYGTGFKAPSLFQLFDPGFGNPDLEPEESAGWDVGVEQSLAGERVSLSAAWFGTDYEELVRFSFPDGFANLGAARVRGLEASVSTLPRDDVRISADYTWTDAEIATGRDDGLPLLRRPRHAADLAVEWARPRGSAALLLRWVGERDDLDFTKSPGERVTLDPYWLVRLTGSARIGANLRLFARVENLLDEEYVEILFFRTPGRALYAGVEAEL